MMPRLRQYVGVLILLLPTLIVTGCLAACETPWKYCGTSGSTNGISVDKVQVANCCSLPCYFTNGQNASLTVVFTADEYYESLVLRLCGQLYGSCIDFPLEHTSICSYISCPLQFGKQYKIKMNVFIKSYWQNVSALARWILEDLSGNTKGCFQLPVVIKSPSKKPAYTPEADAPTVASQPVTTL